jgi:hypothetical protein
MKSKKIGQIPKIGPKSIFFFKKIYYLVRITGFTLGNRGTQFWLLNFNNRSPRSRFPVSANNQESAPNLHSYPPAHAYLEKVDSHGWAMAFFYTTPKCDLIMNNLCEYFNSYIIKAREKPIIIILEMIKKKLMKRYQKKRQGIREYIGD